MAPPMEHDYMGADDTELRLGLPGSDSRVVNGGATAGLTLGCAKRSFADVHEASFTDAGEGAGGATKTALPLPAAKTQIVGWPPIRSYRKNTIASNTSKNNNDDDDDDDAEVKKQGNECRRYVKVSMDGAPYLRKVNLNTYTNYKELSLALEEMFTCFTIGGQCGSNGAEGRVLDLLQGSEHVLTYEDKDGDWMLVGDVPWLMFADSCRRLRIMKGSDTVGIGKGSRNFFEEHSDQELRAR